MFNKVSLYLCSNTQNLQYQKPNQKSCIKALASRNLHIAEKIATNNVSLFSSPELQALPHKM